MNEQFVCRLCRVAYASEGALQNHGYARHGKPSSNWRSSAKDFPPGTVIQRAAQGVRPKATVNPQGSQKSDGYGALIKPAKPPTELEGFTGLPWVRSPKTSALCARLSDVSLSNADRSRDADERAYWLETREYLIALGARLSRKEAA